MRTTTSYACHRHQLSYEQTTESYTDLVGLLPTVANTEGVTNPLAADTAVDRRNRVDVEKFILCYWCEFLVELWYGWKHSLLLCFDELEWANAIRILRNCVVGVESELWKIYSNWQTSFELCCRRKRRLEVGRRRGRLKKKLRLGTHQWDLCFNQLKCSPPGREFGGNLDGWLADVAASRVKRSDFQSWCLFS